MTYHDYDRRPPRGYDDPRDYALGDREREFDTYRDRGYDDYPQRPPRGGYDDPYYPRPKRRGMHAGHWTGIGLAVLIVIVTMVAVVQHATKARNETPWVTPTSTSSTYGASSSMNPSTVDWNDPTLEVEQNIGVPDETFRADLASCKHLLDQSAGTTGPQGPFLRCVYSRGHGHLTTRSTDNLTRR